MQKLTISDFSGGIQESFSPDDFTQRQWSQLKGIIPVDQSTFKSQWPAQRLGSTAADFTAVFPLESPLGTFLVGIKNTGTLWWAKIPPATAAYTLANSVVWRQITGAINYGIPGTAPSAGIPVTANTDYRFITGLSFEAYKYVKAPLAGRESDFTQDILAASVESANVPGVVIGCRRHRKSTTDTELGMWNATTVIPTEDQQMIVAYVDNRVSFTDYSGANVPGVVRIVSFPHFRRWPTYTRNYNSTNPNGTPIANWPQITVDSVVYGIEERAYPIGPYAGSTADPTGLVPKSFISAYPFPDPLNGTYPTPKTSFHPYTYLDLNSTLYPGSGIIPRANVGTMWNGQLILGDIEYRSDKAFEATNTKRKVTVPPNKAVLDFPGLSDDNTDVHRGRFYYSLQDIDIFDPRNVFGVTGSDARIAGMHMLDNYLICITTYNGSNDGVIALSGNLGQVISYTGDDKPFAIRRQLIRGGVGVADYSDTGNGHTTQTCLWPEAGNVVFIDKFGGIYSTDGRSCDRIDRYGPKQPAGSTHYDHVAAVEKHLFAWRNNRLLVLSLLESDGSQASGCWTELALPESAASPSAVKSMIGGAQQMFMVVNGHVWRYCISGPTAEYGYVNGTSKVEAVISTATLGDTNSHKKTNWFRFGFSFYTETECWLKEAYIRGEAMLLSGATVPERTITHDGLGKHFEDGHHEVVYPAGIGTQTVMSARFTFTGNVILKGITVWGAGGVMERGEK